MIKDKTKFGKVSNRFIIGGYLFVIIASIVSIIIRTVTYDQNINLVEQVTTIIVTILFLLIYIFTRHVFAEKYHHIPNQYYYITMIFAFFSTYLGSYLNFYEAFSWWDDVLHLTSGILLGLFSIIIVSYTIGKRFGKYKSRSDIITLVIIGCLLSLSFAVFWEFYEYSYDHFFDGNMQRGVILENPEELDYPFVVRPSGRIVGQDLQDTMFDMLLATLGSIIAGFYAYYHFSSIQLRLDEENNFENEK